MNTDRNHCCSSGALTNTLAGILLPVDVACHVQGRSHASRSGFLWAWCANGQEVWVEDGCEHTLVAAPREARGIASGAILVLIEASAVPVAGVFLCLPLPLLTAAGLFFVGMAGIGRSLERNTELALWDVLQQNAKNMFKL